MTQPTTPQCQSFSFFETASNNLRGDRTVSIDFAKVNRIRELIRAGKYVTPEKILVASERALQEAIGGQLQAGNHKGEIAAHDQMETNIPHFGRAHAQRKYPVEQIRLLLDAD